MNPVPLAVKVLAIVAGSQLIAWYLAVRTKPRWATELYGLVLLSVAIKLLHGSDLG